MRWVFVVLPVCILVAFAGLGGALWTLAFDGAAAGPAPPEDVTSVQAFFPPESSVCRTNGQRVEHGSERYLPEVYTQRIDVDGIAIVAPATVNPRALDEARKTVETVFAHNALEDVLGAAGAYVVIAAGDQQVLDLPEFECLSARPDSQVFENVCGLADQADYPVATVNELDLLGDPDGPCRGLNVLYHELGHLVHNLALDADHTYTLGELYEAAMGNGKYRRQYAGTNVHEYFAEATQNYFLAGEVGNLRDREWLRAYDPGLFALIEHLYEAE